MVPRFSVVIPCRNYAAFVPRAVRSVLAQTDQDFELVVIDDGSTDDSLAVLSALAEGEGARMRVLSQENRGLPATRNRGAREARGDFLVFLDADDELERDALAEFRLAIERWPAAMFVVAGHRSVHPSGGGRVRLLPPLPAAKEARFLAYLRGELRLMQGAAAHRRDVVLGAPYDESLRVGEDRPFFLTVLARQEGVGLARALLVHHKHPDSLRYDAAGAVAGRFAAPDLLFSPGRLPAGYEHHRAEFAARLDRGLMHVHARNGDARAALVAWARALRSHPRTALEPAVLREVARIMRARVRG